MAGLLSQDVVAALRSIKDSYTRQRQALVMQGGSQAASGLATVDKMIAAVDRAILTGEIPIHNMSAAVRASPKFIGTIVARLSRGEAVKLLSVGGGTPGAANSGWWQVQTRTGASGWIERKELFPAGPAMLSSQPGLARTGDHSHRQDIETGSRDTVIF